MAKKKGGAGPSDLSGRLRQAIRASGQSLGQLAEATGVHKAQLSRFLRGERSLRLDAAEKMCDHLGLRLTGPGLDEQQK